MTLNIRPAALTDIDAIVDLLVKDAKQRSAIDADLWKLSATPDDKIRSAVTTAMEHDNPPFRQQWFIAELDKNPVGIAHSILLPVPPIYAGEFGPPGLLMEDCFVAPQAPSGTAQALLKATEDDLRNAGAQILLASCVQGGVWADEYARQGYRPLTLYFAKTGIHHTAPSANVRNATKSDIPGIVASSATNRHILHDLHPAFWKPHADADDRFGAWMSRSLTLDDRDMFVSGPHGDVQGYAISQPATPLHVPAPHDISGIGVIDDFYHDALENPASLGHGFENAMAVFQAAEAARSRRGDTAVLVVCPAAWISKIDLLEQAGYRNAITWFIKIPTVGTR